MGPLSERKNISFIIYFLLFILESTDDDKIVSYKWEKVMGPLDDLKTPNILFYIFFLLFVLESTDDDKILLYRLEKVMGTLNDLIFYSTCFFSSLF